MPEYQTKIKIEMAGLMQLNDPADWQELERQVIEQITYALKNRDPKVSEFSSVETKYHHGAPVLSTQEISIVL